MAVMETNVLSRHAADVQYVGDDFNNSTQYVI